ncbi:hypothetical protein RvY_11741-2 [Ramazzottius varieornatus]|uniref:ABC transporter TMD0 domain-containing protein n=1 Tax=Ramazzottius varieornatus TaxID=947166 RepID=A0A1D1VLF9_RAMVA|nr:hypothetical protein RvY_11741-2 [Ramazzottius varieornatus]
MMAQVFHPFPERFCKPGDHFWDATLSWNTSNPELSECFQQSVLVWIPCLFLWAMLPYQAYRVMTSRYRIHRWTWISIAKTVFCVALAVLALTEMSYTAYQLSMEDLGVLYPDVNLTAVLIKGGTYILAAFYVYLEKRGARPSSGVLFFFWLFMLIGNSVTFRTKLSRAVVHGIEDRLSFGVFMASFPLVFIQFVLSCFAEHFPQREHGEKTPCPEQVRDTTYCGIFQDQHTV